MAIAIVVDNDHKALQAVSDIMRKFGFEVIGAQTIADGASLARSSANVALAIIDIELELTSTPSLVDLLREHHESAFVMLVGNFRTETSPEHLKALAAVSGVPVVLRKPVTAEALARVTRQAFN